MDPARRRALPVCPACVGVVTSATGAALHDILSVIGARAPWTRVLLRSARVQGEGAAEDVARAIDEIGRSGRADVILVGRGGGSLEDLWAFNREEGRPRHRRLPGTGGLRRGPRGGCHHRGSGGRPARPHPLGRSGGDGSRPSGAGASPGRSAPAPVHRPPALCAPLPGPAWSPAPAGSAGESTASSRRGPPRCSTAVSGWRRRCAPGSSSRRARLEGASGRLDALSLPGHRHPQPRVRGAASTARAGCSGTSPDSRGDPPPSTCGWSTAASDAV